MMVHMSTGLDFAFNQPFWTESAIEFGLCCETTAKLDALQPNGIRIMLALFSPTRHLCGMYIWFGWFHANKQ